MLVHIDLGMGTYVCFDLCHVYIYESEPASGITGAIDWIFGSGSGIDGECTACFVGVEAEKREYSDRRRDWQMSVFFCGAKVHFYIIFP